MKSGGEFQILGRRGEGTVSKEAIFLASLPPPPLLFTFETKMATRIGKLRGEHSVSYPG